LNSYELKHSKKCLKYGSRDKKRTNYVFSLIQNFSMHKTFQKYLLFQNKDLILLMDCFLYLPKILKYAAAF
jgi:hypothetical protein